ncbi:MAG: formylglycine-generating enzyme family protein [Myxococcales bacterium]|nr:formylglycine-generating enzyme family protein [Myxococcales bacterium]
MDALRERRAADALLRRFGVAWAERLTLDEHGLCAQVAGFRLRWIPAGEFLMGAPAKEADRRENEPQYPVRISRGFWLGETLVTQVQWLDVMGSNPSRFQDGEDWPSRPVEQVSWNDCQAFLERLPDGLTWRLPTEAEWEYACRAGTTEARYGQLEDVAWYGVDSTKPVGTKVPNAWGLYDMLGNVWEWCADYYMER